MKKLKIIFKMLTKIGLLYFVFFILSPSLKVQAVFSDTANINMGIELKMGTVSLGQKNNNLVESVNYSGGDPVQIASSTLVNDGSLTGKLAYKIDIKKENNLAMTDEELKDVTVNIDFGTFVTTTGLNANNFAFVENSSGKEVVMEPDSKGEIPIKLSYKSTAPAKNEKITVKVTFRLIQSNATDANAKLFSDEKIIENTLTLVPKVLEPESYWPDESTFVESDNGNFKYSLEKMKMLYSETYDTLGSKERQIKNLNKAILYIQIPGNDQLIQSIIKEDGTEEIIPTYIFTQLTTGNEAIEVESRELNEEHHGMVITFKLNDNYSYNPNNPNPHANAYVLSMNITIQKYSMYSPGQYGQYDHSYTSIPFFATQLVLSSDIPSEIDEWNFEYKVIPLSATKKSIIIKQLNGTSHWVNKKEFDDVLLTDEIIEFEVKVKEKEKDSKLVDHSLISKNEFSLKLNPGGNSNEATLNVKITGDTKNTLVISRKLELQNYLMKMKSTKIPSTTKEVEQQTNSEEKIEESSSMIDSTLPNDQVIEEPIDGEDQEEVEEVIDSSSSDSDAELKEETVPIENSDQSTSEEKISDEQINE